MKPALFTQMSTGPRSRSTRPITSATVDASRMSHAYPRAVPPPPMISFAVSSAPSSLRSTIATRQPSAASSSASALPRLRAPPVTSATRSRIPRSIALLPLELRLALAEERLDALGGVLGAEDLQEGARLDLERLVDRRVEPVVHRFDDEPRRDGRPLADLPRERLRVVDGLALLRHLVDEPERRALGGGDLRAENHRLECLAASD